MVRQRLKSIMTLDYDTCYICGVRPAVHIHHIFNKADKKASEKYGLVVPVCVFCHTGSNEAIHNYEYNNLRLKARAQRVFESIESRDKFIEVFGRDYIEKLIDFEDRLHKVW